MIWKIKKKGKQKRLFDNTLTPDDKYSLLNRDNLTQPVHMKLSHN